MASEAGELLDELPECGSRVQSARPAADGDPVAVCQDNVFMTSEAPENRHHANDLISQQSTGMAEFSEFRPDGFRAREQPVYMVADDIVFRCSPSALPRMVNGG